MLTIREAAARLGAAEISVRQWAKRGRLEGAELIYPPAGPAYWMIPARALEGFEKQKPGPKPRAAAPAAKPRRGGRVG